MGGALRLTSNFRRVESGWSLGTRLDTLIEHSLTLELSEGIPTSSLGGHQSSTCDERRWAQYVVYDK